MFNLQAEEKCGHLITEETKKLWAVALGCLEEVKRICKKHNIKYFAGGGTLLGAVRHKGFIPWDDDIDLFMLSEDYARFCQIAAQEIQAPYFFQHYTTQDVNSVVPARIRNSNTTGCTEYEYSLLPEKEEYNCGIFIDIFPLNYVPESKWKIALQRLCIKLNNAALGGYYTVENKQAFLGEQKSSRKTILFWRVLSLFINYDQLIHAKYKVRDMFHSGKKVGLIAFAGHIDKYIWNKDWFNETVELPFEDTTICCPKEYDKILRHQYGDYNVFVKGAQLHSLLIVDPDTPYEQKLKEYAAEPADKG